MKKVFARKNAKWLATAAAAALFLSVFVPVSMGLMNSDPILDVGLGNSVARTDTDNLFIYMMNRSLPVGSIYMTDDPALSTVPLMNAHFGGTWEVWGEGRVPVGVDGIKDSPFEFNNQTGGKLNATTGAAAVPLVSPAWSIKGGISITKGSLTRTDSGGVTFSSTAPVVTGSGSGVTYQNTGVTLTNANLPSHTHENKLWITYNSLKDGNNSIFTDSSRRRAQSGADPGSAGDGGYRYRDTRAGYTNDLCSYWSLDIKAPSPNGAAFTVAVTSFNFASYSATFSVPNRNYTPPEPSYTGHEIQSQSYSVTSGGATVSFKDETEQPYQTVYMYRRATLADLK